MAAEMRHHLELQEEANRRAGMTPGEARYAAQRQFGNVGSIQERAREQRGWGWLDRLAKDASFSVRTLAQARGFTATALMTLGLCLGANLAIFAVVDAVLLRPLPFPSADRLVTMYNTYPKAGVMRDGSSITNYYERRGQIDAVESLALVNHGTAVVGEAGATRREFVSRVSPEFFETLGSSPVLGRSFTEAETSTDLSDVAILTDDFWRANFAADPDVLGKEVRVNGRPRKIVGVLAPGFKLLSAETRIFVPFASSVARRGPDQRHSGGGETNLIARLKPGYTVTDAQTEIDRHNDRMEKDSPEAKFMADAGFRTLVVSLRGDHVAAIRPVLWLTQAGGLLLLVIGAVNLVNLLLIRASGRTKELAVRQALGASRRHVISGTLTESLLLAGAGGALGLWFGRIGVNLLTAFGANRLPLGAGIATDARWTLAALAGVIGLSICMAVPVVWFNLRLHLAGAMQTESRGSTGNRAAQRLRHAFIVAQIALAFVLLTGAGLLGLSFQRALATSPGFRPEGTQTAQITLPSANYRSDAAMLAFLDRLTAEFSEVPGVSAVGFSRTVPLDGTNTLSAVTVKNQVRVPGESPRGYYTYGVAGDYFGALGIPLRAGRFLNADDTHRPERVCVVDEDFAARHWPAGEAIGRQLFDSSAEEPGAKAFTVVGVVGAVKQASVTDTGANGAVYYPFQFRSSFDFHVAVRSTLSPEPLAAAVRRALRQADPELPAAELRTMESRVADSLIGRRSPALLTGLFALAALLLTAVGTYGVLSYAVAQRQREISVRMALGARPEQIRWQFLEQGARLLGAGVGLGLLGAAGIGWTIRSLLYGVSAFHGPTLLGTAVLMAAISLVACLLPAHRAAKVDPIIALRAE